MQEQQAWTHLLRAGNVEDMRKLVPVYVHVVPAYVHVPVLATAIVYLGSSAHLLSLSRSPMMG